MIKAGGHLPLMPSNQEQRYRLGNQLRALRQSNGFSALRLAKRTGLSQSRITRAESGSVLLGYVDLSTILEALGVSDWERAQVVQSAANLFPLPEQDIEVVRLALDLQVSDFLLEAEARATAITELAVLIVPGWLQTAAYAQEQMAMAGIPEERIADLVARRLNRQRLLFEPGRSFRFVIFETALGTIFGSNRLMAAQLMHLASLASLPSVSLGVVPRNVVLPAVPYMNVMLLDQYMFAFDTPLGLEAVRSTAEVASMERQLELFADRAVWSDDAIELVQRSRNEMSATVTVDLTQTEPAPQKG